MILRFERKGKKKLAYFTLKIVYRWLHSHILHASRRVFVKNWKINMTKVHSSVNSHHQQANYSDLSQIVLH